MKNGAAFFSEPDNHSDSTQKTSTKSKNESFEWLKAIIIAVVLVFLIRWLLFAPFIVDGSSMQPNFHTSERIIVNKILYDFRDPKVAKLLFFMCPQREEIL